MIQTIGPNFANEIAAAGLARLPFSWGADGVIEYGAAVTDAQKAAIASVLAAHDPAAPNLVASVQVNSTGTPALNGLYAIDKAAQQTIAAIAAGIAAKGRVPGGGATFNYFDDAGTPHAFSGANFLNFAAAIEDYAYAVTEGVAALMGGRAPTWPTSPLTIA